MLSRSRQLIYLIIIPALFLNTSCGGQKSKNNSKESKGASVTRDSGVIAASDTMQKSEQNSIAPPVAALGEITPDASHTGSKQGLKVGSKAINQPPFENSMIIKPERSKEVSEGLKLAKAGNMSGAIAKFDEAIKKEPKNGEACFFKAKAEIELKEYENAMTDLNLAIERNRSESLYFYYRGKLYSDGGNQEMAIKDFDNAIEIQNDFPDAYNYRGVAKAKLRKQTEAIADYDICLKQNPKYAMVYYNKGTSQATLSDYKGAIETFTRGLELDPTQVKAYLNRGNCLLMTNNVEGALADFDKVLSINPQSADAYYNRGYAKYFGKREGMCDDWRKALSLGHKEAAKMLDEHCK
jgi:tetratricopeptide (TPR) repeat protein